MVTDNTVKGPSPIFILLTAVKRAVDAGVERDKISTMLAMSIQAATSKNDGKPKQQSPIFSTAADTLNGYVQEVKPDETVQP